MLDELFAFLHKVFFREQLRCQILYQFWVHLEAQSVYCLTYQRYQRETTLHHKLKLWVDRSTKDSFVYSPKVDQEIGEVNKT